MKLNRKKTSLALLVFGILGISVGLTPWFILARISYLKAQIPKRVYEIDKEMIDLNNDPNSDIRDYWSLLGEANKLDWKTNWFNNVGKINTLVVRQNSTRKDYRAIGFTGLTFGVVGYVWRKRK